MTLKKEILSKKEKINYMDIDWIAPNNFTLTF